MTDEIEALIIGGIVFVASYTIYLLIGLFCSPFISFKREKEKGNYFNNRFVYHDPLHVYTTIIKPEDHGKNITFMVNDAEPNSLVCFDFQYRGGLSYVSVFTPQDHVKNLSQSENFRSMKMSKRINKRRQATFVCSSSPNSDDTQLRVYMLSWEY